MHLCVFPLFTLFTVLSLYEDTEILKHLFLLFIFRYCTSVLCSAVISAGPSLGGLGLVRRVRVG